MHGAMEAANTITIVLSLCRGGSLCDTMGAALDAQSPMEEAKVHRTFTQLCGALHYCHRHGVVHKDIKLDNLCWADPTEQRLVLIDFGYAATSNFASNFAGSPHYAAPEVHRALMPGMAEYTCTQADVFSCGVCLFAMLATQLPFAGGEDTDEERSALSAKVVGGVWDPPPPWSDPARCPAAFDVAIKMLITDPEARATLDDVCAHEWVGGAEAIPWRGTAELAAQEKERQAATVVASKPRHQLSPLANSPLANSATRNPQPSSPSAAKAGGAVKSQASPSKPTPPPPLPTVLAPAHSAQDEGDATAVAADEAALELDLSNSGHETQIAQGVPVDEEGEDAA